MSVVLFCSITAENSIKFRFLLHDSYNFAQMNENGTHTMNILYLKWLRRNIYNIVLYCIYFEIFCCFSAILSFWHPSFCLSHISAEAWPLCAQTKEWRTVCFSVNVECRLAARSIHPTHYHRNHRKPDGVCVQCVCVLYGCGCISESSTHTHRRIANSSFSPMLLAVIEDWLYTLWQKMDLSAAATGNVIS